MEAFMDSGPVTKAKVESALGQLDDLANNALQTTGAPGLAIAVVYQDQILFLKGFGIRETGKPEPIDPDTVFQLASVSKSISSTIVAGVVGDGLVDWDTPVITHLPDFQLGDPYVTHAVTLRDMFSHRSSLPAHAGDGLQDAGFDRTTILHRLRYLPVGNRFRSTYAYTNSGITVGAVAAASAAGKPWDALCQERLFGPLEMTSTSSRYEDFAHAPNRAPGHVRVNGRWAVLYSNDDDVFTPAGGVCSTVRDMAKWVRLQLGGGKFEGRQIIDAKSLAETHHPLIDRGATNPVAHGVEFYGLGWIVATTEDGLVRLNHTGDFSTGASTGVYMLPSEGLGIVVLTNMLPVGVPEAISLSFLDLVLYGTVRQDYLGILGKVLAGLFDPTNEYSKPPAETLPALPAAAYTGTYANDFVGTVEVAATNEQLTLLIGPQKKTFPLQHYNRDVFTLAQHDAGTVFLSGVTFTIGGDGKASKVLIENLDTLDQGTLTRTG
jgi:CubicO group peptidase (beta-lactamase class C family)